eukprot:1357787-Rhodomonas_salina.1
MGCGTELAQIYGTELAYGAMLLLCSVRERMVLCCCYGMCGTDTAYGATQVKAAVKNMVPTLTGT